MTWNISLVSEVQLSNLSRVRRPSGCVNTVQQELKQRVISIVLVTNLKTSTIPSAKKKVNSMPARPSTLLNNLSSLHNDGTNK